MLGCCLPSSIGAITPSKTFAEGVGGGHGSFSDDSLEGAKAQLPSSSLGVGAVYAPQVFKERQIGLGYALDVADFEVDSGVGLLCQVVLLVLGLGVVLGQGEGSLASIANLATVPAGIFVVIPVLTDVVLDIVLVDLDVAASSLVAVANHVEVQSADSASRDPVKLRVVQDHVDARGEGFVKIAHTISGEEKNAGVVLKDS